MAKVEVRRYNSSRKTRLIESAPQMKARPVLTNSSQKTGGPPLEERSSRRGSCRGVKFAMILPH